MEKQSDESLPATEHLAGTPVKRAGNEVLYKVATYLSRNESAALEKYRYANRKKIAEVLRRALRELLESEGYFD